MTFGSFSKKKSLISSFSYLHSISLKSMFGMFWKSTSETAMIEFSLGLYLSNLMNMMKKGTL